MEVFFLLIIGLTVGAFGTLIGAGGGFILMPILFFLYPQESSEQLTSISLMVVFFNALSGSIAYGRKKRIDYRSGLLFALASIPGAILGALTISYIPRNIFDPIFSSILILMGGFLLIRPESQKRREENKTISLARFKRVLIEKDGTTHHISYNAPLGVFLSILIGFLASFLGIGGGIIHVPILSNMLHFPVHIATATSHFILAIVALCGSLVHVLNGTFKGSLTHVFILIPSVVVGAQVGAAFSHKVRKRSIIRFLAMALILVGIRIFIGIILKT